MTTSLSQLAQLTTIVADTGDIDAIKRLQPTEATTNPSLITSAFLDNKIDADILAHAQSLPTDDAIDYLTVALGAKISQVITGRVSTEVDARLSFDTQKTIQKAQEYIALYDKLGVPAHKVLIKIASTFEGIAAAKVLEQEGIGCNLTLLFTQTQAKACADAGVTLISPFVGRITDWQKKHENKTQIAIADDMGVQSVKDIYQFYKAHGYTTQVMGASFRSTEQILALAGCDLLTISPMLLDALQNSTQPVARALTAPDTQNPKPTPLSVQDFQAQQQEHPLNSLLLQGIDGFVQARQKLFEALSA